MSHKSFSSGRFSPRLLRLYPVYFLLLLLFTAVLPALSAAKIPCVWTGVEKIVAVGDLHGAYENFVEILKGTKVVDENLHWIAGKTHLVQMGDIMDRGPDARKIFDLLIGLEKEAENAGGKVHVLLGNHEMINIAGIAFDYAGYVIPEQLVSFLPEDYRKQREKDFAEHIAGIKPQDLDTNLDTNPDLRKYWQALIKVDPMVREKYKKFFNAVYKKWLLKHNAVIKINGVVFVHGGISPGYSTWKLEDLNGEVRTELDYLSGPVSTEHGGAVYQPRIAFDRDGPFWYRDLAYSDEPEFKGEVDKILANLKADAMVIAHTRLSGSPVSMEFMTRFNGRIWTIDTGISTAFDNALSALIIENGKFIVWGGNDEK